VVAVLAPVLDQAGPGPAGFDRGPEVAEGLFRHVGVAHDVVRLAQQLVTAVTADGDEILVAVGDAAFEVGHRDQGLVFGKGVGLTRDRLVVAHGALEIRVACRRWCHQWRALCNKVAVNASINP